MDSVLGPGTRAAPTDPAGVDGRIAVGGLLGGRYRLESRIGAGGMATIFRARDESLDRVVAIKVLHAHLADDPGLLERFRTEARHVASLLHPHIVNVFDQGAAELPYIVMEYVDGPSLREVLNHCGRLTPAAALAVVVPICAALARSHAAGVVHRDVKPENVLIAGDGVPKVADFGIARALAATSHTTAGTLIGSVHYLAPELVDGQEATPRSDQYALGVLLFELLTGRKPLPADSPMAVALRHAREAIPPPSAFASDCSPALDQVVARATAADPAKRYPDLRALVQALREAVPAGPAPLAVVHPDQDGRERTLVIPAHAQDTVATETSAEVAQRRHGRAARHRWNRRVRPVVLPLLMALLAALLAGGGFALWNWVLAPARVVPDLRGLSEVDARSRLEEQGLDLAVAGNQTSPSVPPGSVVRQEPPAGAGLRRGRAVAVWLSEGPATVAMPRVLDMPEQEARRLLEGEPYHFQVQVHRDWSDTVAAGLVQAQLPDPETSLEQGQPAIINVSRGVEQVVVPDLSGSSREQAEQLLAARKLRVAFAQRYSDDVPQVGAVIGQSVRAGTTVDKNTTVTVTVSAGPVTFAMPNVEGTGVQAARARLAELGLRVNVTEQERPQVGPFRRGDFGRVEAQVPRPGEPVRRGDRVDLYTFTQAAERGGGA
ncbi:MAG: Stk1 family PASTA domain-containing Ser/Thr kinase [Actinomycetota bacterium]|nr:Stk1 family PASTA domain-containing Ser/Thr kinase [Actinomycetota bacterium]